MRQEVIALYRAFQQQRLLKLEKRALDLEGQMISSITGLEGGEVMEMKMKHLEAVENWQKNVKSWREKVGDFFMASYDAIDLSDKGLPDISYRATELDFTDTGRWGLLQLNLLALEQIAEEGQIAEAYFRYLPRANFSVSAPPLYNNNSSESFDLEGIGHHDAQLAGVMRGDLVERRTKPRVALDHHDVGRARRQQRPGQAPGSGADLDHASGRQVPGREGDAPRQVEIEQEMLSERFAREETVALDDAAERWKTVHRRDAFAQARISTLAWRRRSRR